MEYTLISRTGMVTIFERRKLAEDSVNFESGRCVSA